MPEVSDFYDDFTRLFLRSIALWANAATFRKLAHLGLPYAEGIRIVEHQKNVQDLLNNEKYEGLLTDPLKFASDGSVQRMPLETMAREKQSFLQIIDSTSLVFVHSGLDAIVYDAILLISRVRPEDWNEVIKEKRISIKEISSLGYTQAYEQTLKAHIEQALERESLLKKIDILHQVIRPDSGRNYLSDFHFDRKKVQDLDNKRHTIIHKPALEIDHSTTEEDLWYLGQCAIYVVSLLNARYRLKINPDVMVNSS